MVLHTSPIASKGEENVDVALWLSPVDSSVVVLPCSNQLCNKGTRFTSRQPDALSLVAEHNLAAFCWWKDLPRLYLA